MVLTVTLNPAIDKILILDGFQLHKLHRLHAAEKSMVAAGGKGVNIAQALVKMGDEVIASGFAGEHTGHLLCDSLRQAGITTSFIFTQGATRTNIAILDRVNETLTEINDFGQHVPADDIQFFLENYERLLNRVELVVIAGSLPKGIEPSVFSQLIGLAHEKGVKTLIHTSPEFAEIQLKDQPFLINPDMRSHHVLFGKEIDGIEQFLSAGRSIINDSRGTEFVIFTHRLENVVVVTREKGYVLRPKNLKIINMLGYGDAYLAGFIHAYNQKLPVREVLVYASASGLTNVEQLSKEVSEVDKIEMNLSRIDVEEVNFD